MTSRQRFAEALELWGGVECTVNRVGDRYRDQTRLSGHQDRLEDLDLLAAIGIRKLRYPVLWERVAPDDPESRDWRWSDERLARLRALKVEPIVGLLHHGSGPRYTSLIDPHFATLLGDYAGAVATRYPDVTDWTPVNEPLTTARFSALYGHWYPHARDERLFWTAMLNQIDGTRAAMRAIRRVNSEARLIQTEDLGRCYATPAKLPVAAHYNERRWMTWDLLAGRVTRQHPLWSTLDDLGLGDRLRVIADDPCPADVLGVNHYVTSDRFLDDRAHGAPLPEVGYDDVAAVRALETPSTGLAGALGEAWSRYGCPLAVTECHLNCTREEQLRWIAQAWDTCQALRVDGVAVEAFTAWALLGSFDWNSLLTLQADTYEVGAFDVRDGTARPTAVAELLASLAGGPAVPKRVEAVLHGPGWWQRDMRLDRPAYRTGSATSGSSAVQRSAPLLITGATGTLGQAFARFCGMRGLAHVLTSRADLAIEDPDMVAAVLDHHRPWAVINAAGWVRVDEAEEQAAACHRANAHGAGVLARACASRGIHCTLFSSDLVFDGTAAPYDEEAGTAPLGVYGASKAAAERQAAAVDGGVLVIRTAAFFSPDDPHNFAMAVERAVQAGQVFGASPDHVVTPTFVPDLVQACLDLVIDGATGTWHLTNDEAVSWLAFGRRVAAALGLDATLVVPASAEELGWRAVRPRDAALRTIKGRRLPTLTDALTRHAQTRRREQPRSPPVDQGAPSERTAAAASEPFASEASPRTHRASESIAAAWT